MKRIIICAMMLVVVVVAMTAASQYPSPRVYTTHFPDGVWVNGMSANGKYAVLAAYTPDNTLYDFYAKLLDVDSGKVTDLMSGYKNLTACGAQAVSDNGVVVGTFGTGWPISNPAYWTAESGWRVLPYPEGNWEGGFVSDITPDGKYAVGKVYRSEMMIEEPMLWDLSGSEAVRVATPNVPRRGSAGEDHQMVRFESISANGRFVAGCVSFSYTWDTLYFVYDRVTESTVHFGKTVIDGVAIKNPGNYTLSFGGPFSPDGNLVAGAARTKNGSVPATLNIYDGTVTIYDGEPYDDAMIRAVTNDGSIFISTPPDIPLRTWSVRAGRYWVSFEDILKQIYGTNMDRLTGYQDVTSGTIMGINGDGTRIASLIYNQVGESYVLTLPESPAKLASTINLLDDYTMTPAEGSSISSLTTAQVRFTRAIDVLGGNNSARIVDAEGNVIANSIKFALNSISDMTVDISFRRKELTPGKRYYLEIPEGAISLKDDPKMTNKEIRLRFEGRAAEPVKLLSVSPDPKVPLVSMGASQNPLLLTFDTKVTVTENATGMLTRVNGGIEEDICTLGASPIGNQVLIYPLVDQNLFEGSTYRITIGAGSIADVQGDNGCDEIILEYQGSYVPEFISDFKNNFDDGSWISAFMFYEGDHNQPSIAMQNWNFLDGDNYPWWWVRDTDQSPDYALASHSMYTPSGKSDDWLIIPHLYVADDDYPTTLTFKSQSYKNAAKDRLKVVIWETDYLTSYPTEAFMQRFKAEGKVVYDELQSPGKKEEVLEGDWRDNTISLADYKGKGIYIAFLNDNDNQSAVFIDDVAISHDVDFTVTVDNDRAVVGQSEVLIKGRVRLNNSGETFSNFNIALLDGAGNQVDELNLAKPGLKAGDIFSFAFTKPLTLVKGRINNFVVKVTSGEKTVSLNSSISNLYFQPEKRVVVEEFTGQGCGFCPLGIIVLEKLEEAYGDRVLPIAIHTYQGDSFASGLSGYSSYLGINGAAPSATVNRDRGVYYPMESVDGRYSYMGKSSPLIWDAVVAEMAISPVADIAHKDSKILYDEDNNIIAIPVEVTFALDQERTNYNLMTVLVEDGLKGSQSNYLSGSNDPLTGEWGAGGIYGSSTVKNYTYNDVARGLCGVTYNGTPGLIPANVTGGRTYETTMLMNIPYYVEDLSKCKAVTMLLDGNTGKVLNAVRSKLEMADLSGMDTVAEDAIGISKHGSDISVKCPGRFHVEVYAIDGRKVANAFGEDGVTFSVAVKGVAIVRVLTDQGGKTCKLRF